jgi:acetoacetyl-CoA synthetase
VAPLWIPSVDRSSRSAVRSFLDAAGFADYESAWEWSVAPGTAGAFWAMVADRAGVEWFEPPIADLVRSASAVTGAEWFPGGRLNYAASALKRTGGEPAVVALSDTSGERTISWDELRSSVARLRAGLVARGVGPGDTVAGYLPNIPETLELMLAVASIGAVWTCCSPEVGAAGCLDRLAQCRPKVLVAVDGYRYGERAIDRRAVVEDIRAGLPGAQEAVILPYLFPSAVPGPGWTSWSSLAAGDGPLEFEPVPFGHPLYVLYSSGTTGKPKAIIHGHGGILLEHHKALSLHFDLGPTDRFFWFSTTGWMMWNLCVSGLLTGSTVVLFDGDPSGDRLWQIMASTETSVGGIGAGYAVAAMKAGQRPGADFDLSGLVTLGATGSPLPAAAAEWAYREVAPDLMLASFSGGTDVCTGFVGTSPLHAVWAGEISCRCLGAAVEVFDESGRPVVEREGELVITAPLPSMPVGIVGDPDGRRYRATYFEQFPGVWAHGDRATLTDRGTVVISGRSDGTLNRGGVRMGTAEFYSVVEALPEVADSLAVHLEDEDGGPGELFLFVVPASPDVDREALAASVRAALRRDLSPRHVPDVIDLIPVVPRTLSGKKLEVPVKRILSGVPVNEAVALPSVAEPASLDPFVEMADRRS